jgi:hypothetical protein
MTRAICLVCLKPEDQITKTLLESPAHTICLKCILSLFARLKLRGICTVPCASCVTKLFQEIERVPPISLLCSKCMSELLQGNQTLEPALPDGHQSKILSKWRGGYVIEVAGFAEEAFLVTSRSYSPGAIVGVLYVGIENGKHFFGLDPRNWS